jgi:CRISPR-associated Csx2 family protein
MANILITSFGNGTVNHETGEYEYKEASYFDEKSGRTVAKPQHLIIPAIHELFDIGKTILIGTTGSNWPLLYKEVMAKRSGFTPKSRVRDEEYYALLKSYHARSRDEMLAVSEMRGVLAALQDELGDAYPKICLLKYGINEDEQWYNFGELMKTISTEVSDGDSIFFDITHSFRSLPMYALLLTKSLQKLKKDIRIEMIPYGMFEAKSYYDGKAPIVDMSPLGEMVDWTSALTEYETGGTANQLVALLGRDTRMANEIRSELRQDSMDALRLLDNAMTANDVASFSKLIDAIRKVENDPTSLVNISDNLYPFKVIFDKIIDDFGSSADDPVRLLFAVADWHMRYGRALQAAITLNNAVDSWIQPIVLKSMRYNGGDDELNYKAVAKVLRTFLETENPVLDDADFTRFTNNFFEMRKLRNEYAHGLGAEAWLIGRMTYYIGYFSDLYASEENTQRRKSIEETIMSRAKGK